MENTAFSATLCLIEDISLLQSFRIDHSAHLIGASRCQSIAIGRNTAYRSLRTLSTPESGLSTCVSVHL